MFFVRLFEKTVGDVIEITESAPLAPAIKSKGVHMLCLDELFRSVFTQILFAEIMYLVFSRNRPLGCCTDLKTQSL